MFWSVPRVIAITSNAYESVEHNEGELLLLKVLTTLFMLKIQFFIYWERHN